MDCLGAVVISFVFGIVIGTAVGIVKSLDLEGFTCTQSQIIDGKAECVEYRRVEK